MKCIIACGGKIKGPSHIFIKNYEGFKNSEVNETELVVGGFKYSPWAELAAIFTFLYSVGLL